MFPIVQIPQDAANLPEQLGTRPKFWYTTPDSGEALFKEVRQETGEDWSEKVACRLCNLLGLPHAEYSFAVYRGRRGVVTVTFVPARGRLVLGNELLARAASSYAGVREFRSKQHTLRTVLAYLKSADVLPPLDWIPPPDIGTGIDVFVGYLLLDAWIANQDRHHENWGVVVSPDSAVHLAPTYDHASSLGRGETDSARTDRLETRDKGRSVLHYVQRGQSAFYPPSGEKPLGTLDAFIEAGRIRPNAAKAWLDKLAAIPQQQVAAIFDDVPEQLITLPAKRFALEILRLNRERLLSTRPLFE
jgi:hypothetical protein